MPVLCLESYFCQGPTAAAAQNSSLSTPWRVLLRRDHLGNHRKEKTAVGFIILFPSNWKLAGENTSCRFMQFKEEEDYLLICFKLHKTVFLMQGCNTGCKDESSAHGLTDHQ